MQEQEAAAGMPLVYDVGMHHGEDTDFYLKKGFRVVAIEAIGDYCDAARERFAAAVDRGQLRLLNVAIAAETGTVKFYRNEKKSVWGTIDPEFAALRSARGAAVTCIEVPAVTFDSVLAEHGVPYYLKVDIEGADRLCLQALAALAVRPRFVSIEAEILAWERLVSDLDGLVALGYQAFKAVQQLTVRQQRCPNPPREGRYVAHRFPKSASGMFGEEAPGEWLDRAAIEQRFRRIFRLQRWFGSGGVFGASKPARWLIRDLLHIRPGWYDIHARHSAPPV
jgi:FkbM family methyltransferase